MRPTAAHISIALLALLCACSASTPPDKYDDYPSEVSVAYLKSLCKVASTVIRRDVTVTGRVVATDKLSEFSRTVVVADDSGGIELAIDSDRTDVMMPLYSRVTIHCQMLALGDYAGKIVLGAQPTSQYVVDRIAETDLPHYIEVLSTADAPPDAHPATIGSISPADISRYVVIDRVRFADEEAGLTWCDIDPETSRFIDTYRHIVDAEGDTLAVFTRAACVYASERVPSATCRIYGIIDCFNGQYSLTPSNHRIITE